VLKRVIEPNKEEVTGGWLGLHNKKLHIFFATLNSVRVFISRRIIWRDM